MLPRLLPPWHRSSRARTSAHDKTRRWGVGTRGQRMGRWRPSFGRGAPDSAAATRPCGTVVDTRTRCHRPRAHQRRASYKRPSIHSCRSQYENLGYAGLVATSVEADVRLRRARAAHAAGLDARAGVEIKSTRRLLDGVAVWVLRHSSTDSLVDYHTGSSAARVCVHLPTRPRI